MCFNYNKRNLFVGTADSFSAQLGGSFNSLVPSVYCLECSGYELIMLDKLEIPEMTASLGVFTVQSHPTENIVFCTFVTRVLVAAFTEGNFKKFKIVEGFSDSAIYQSCLSAPLFCGYCPKEESLNILTFTEKSPSKGGSYQWSSALEHERAVPKVEQKQAPLVAKYSYAIPEFKNNVKFTLVDSFLGLMFVFTSQEIFKCVITRKSLTLDDKSAMFGNLE